MHIESVRASGASVSIIHEGLASRASDPMALPRSVESPSAGRADVSGLAKRFALQGGVPDALAGREAEDIGASSALVGNTADCLAVLGLVGYAFSFRALHSIAGLARGALVFVGFELAAHAGSASFAALVVCVEEVWTGFASVSVVSIA